MAQGGIKQELFDAIMKEMVGSYEVSEVPGESLTMLTVPGVPAPGASKTQSVTFDEANQSSSQPRSVGRDVGRDVDRSRSSSRQRSKSPYRSRNRYSKDRGRGYSCSRSSDSSSDDCRRGRPRERSPWRSYSGRHDDKTQNKDGATPPQKKTWSNTMSQVQTKDARRSSGSVRDRQERDRKERGRQGGSGSSAYQQPPRKDKEENQMKAILAETDALSKLGVHLIRWAGFHAVTRNEFTNEHFSDCQLTTEAFSKMLTSFKCSLKQEHRSHCFRYVRNLRHSAFSAPHLDPDFLNLVVEKGAVGSKETFGEVINPLDQHLLTLQISLLKCAHPMFLACNEYELNLKEGNDTRSQLFTALEKIISLCRKTLVLIGMSYSLTSSFRQDRILEAVDLIDATPKPSDYPNLEDSYLFGKEYMTKLRNWLDKSGHPVKLTFDMLTPEQKQQQVLQAKMQEEKGERTADPVTIQAIDHLLEYNVKNWRLNGTDDGKPQFWFLFDETSAEYKYYRFKMLEMQKLKRATMDAKVQADDYYKSPQDMADESVRAMILARKTSALKKKLFRDLAISKKRRFQRSTAGTQTDLNMSQVEDLIKRVEHSTPKQCLDSDAEKAKAFTSDTCPQFSEVDVGTKETAENLARFLVEMGPELSEFNLDVLSNNPEFWFLNEKQSPAYKFYYMKLTEFRHASGLTYDPHASSNQADAGPQDSESKNLKRQEPNQPERKALGPKIYDPDCEHVERQKVISHISGSLVSYFSDSSHSDGEDHSHPTPKHKRRMYRSFLLQDGTLKSHYPQDERSQASTFEDWKPRLQNPKSPPPVTQSSVSKDHKPEPPLPQDEKYQSLLPQDRESEILVTQGQKTPSKEASLHSPDHMSEPLKAMNQESDKLLSQDQAPETTLSKGQEFQTPLSQKQTSETPLSQNKESGNRLSQVEPEDNLYKGQEETSQSQLLSKDEPETPQAKDLAPQPQDQRSQTSLSRDKEPIPQDEKSQCLLPSDQRREISLPQDRRTEPQEQTNTFQDQRFPPPPFQNLIAPPSHFREQEPGTTHPAHQKPQPQYLVQHPEDQQSKPPHPQEQRPQLFFPVNQNPQSCLPQSVRPEPPLPHVQTPYPRYPNPQPQPSQNWMFQPQDRMHNQALPRYYNPQVPPPSVQTFLPPAHHVQIPQLSLPRGQIPLPPIPQVLHQGQKLPLPVPQDWKPQLPPPPIQTSAPRLFQGQVPSPQDQRPKGSLHQGLAPSFPLPLERIPLPPSPQVRNPQDLKSQSLYFPNQTPQASILQDPNPRPTLQQGMNPQFSFLQNQKHDFPPSHDWKSQDLQHLPTPLPDQKPPLSRLQDQNLPHFPQDLKAQSLDQTAQTPSPQDQKPQLPLPQNEKPQLSLVQEPKSQILQPENQMPQLPLPQDQKPQVSIVQDPTHQIPQSQDQKPQLSLVQGQTPQHALPPDQKPKLPLPNDQEPQLQLPQEQTPEQSVDQDSKPPPAKTLYKDQKPPTLLLPNQKPPTSLSQNPKASNLLPQDWNLHISVRKLMPPQTPDTQKFKTTLGQDQKLKHHLSQDQAHLPQDGKPQTSETQNPKPQTSVSIQEEPHTPESQDLNQPSRPQNPKSQTPFPNIHKHPSLLAQDRKSHTPQSQNTKPQMPSLQNLKRHPTSPQNLKSQTPVLQRQISRLSLPQDWKPQTPLPPKYEKSQPLFPIEQKSQISQSQNQKSETIVGENRESDPLPKRAWKSETSLPQDRKPHAPLFKIQRSLLQDRKRQSLVSQKEMPETPVLQTQKPEAALIEPSKPQNPLSKNEKTETSVFLNRKPQTTVPQGKDSEAYPAQGQKPLSQDKERKDCLIEDLKAQNSALPVQKLSTPQHSDSTLEGHKGFKLVPSETYSSKLSKNEYSDDSDSEGLGPVLPEFKPRSSLVKSAKHKRSKRVRQLSSPEIQEEKDSKSSKKSSRKKAKRRKRSASPTKSPHRRKRARSPKAASVSSKKLCSDDEAKVHGKMEIENLTVRLDIKKKQPTQAAPIITKWPDMEKISQERGGQEVHNLAFEGRVVRDPCSTSRPFGMDNLIVTVRRSNPAEK
ncbi:mediator of DNA damage checkpoint protein 1-like [Pleurodeles waltl]|uniref:mediator of DNA damage checkpoint protein 1-like n=1 Tax=Pleurodeles waltl TaxID=8319 RepID=UPI003709A4CA